MFLFIKQNLNYQITRNNKIINHWNYVQNRRIATIPQAGRGIENIFNFTIY